MDTNDDASLQAWMAIQQQLPIDSRVTGVVVRKEPYGAWIDIGVGFPALLEIIYIERLTPEKYRTGDWCPVGSEVEATVSGFADFPYPQIRLWQAVPQALWEQCSEWRRERGLPPPPVPCSS